MTFWLRKLMGASITLLGVSVLTFLLVSAAPGDAVSDAQMNPDVPHATLEAMRERLQLDEAWPVHYGKWVSGLARGDWGRSLISGLPVRELVVVRAGRTLGLATVAMLTAWVLTGAFAVSAISHPGGWVDRCGETITYILFCIPEMVLTLLLLLAFGRDGGNSAALAALTLATIPPLWRQMRAAGGRAATLPFVEAARANGVAPALIWSKYLLPAAAVPLISFAGASVGGLLSTSLVVECVAGYGGLGPLMLEAVLARDLPVVAAAVLMTAVLWMAGGLLSDVALYALDPRLRMRQ